jgi:hypothetical protein
MRRTFDGGKKWLERSLHIIYVFTTAYRVHPRLTRASTLLSLLDGHGRRLNPGSDTDTRAHDPITRSDGVEQSSQVEVGRVVV